MRLILGRPSRRLVLLTAAVAALASGVAYATVPDGGGVINSCYNGSNGAALRLVDAAGDCKKNEVALAWNQRGAPGAAGVAGAKGDTGPKGDKGDPGPKGDTGAVGATGPAGANGAAGATGATGAQGPKGDQGDTGPQGLKGDKGDPGATGPAGTSGDTLAFVKTRNVNSGPAILIGFGTEVPVLSMNVPAGNYLVHGKVELVNSSANSGTVVCSINASFDGDATATIPTNSALTLNATDVVRLAAPGAIRIGCYIGLGFANQTFLVRNTAALHAVPFTTIATLP